MPKIVGLIAAATFFKVEYGMVAIAAAMAMGGLLNARKVASVMSKDISYLNHGQGLTANIVTGLLVIFASRLGFPVSTTHVSVGSLFGIGLANRSANLRVISRIVAAWGLTLPAAALASGAAYAALLRFLAIQ